MRVQIGQDGLAFSGCQTLDVGGVSRADVNGFAPRHRVNTHHRVQVASGHVHDLQIAFVRHGVVAQSCRHGGVHVVPCRQTLQVLLHAFRQSVISRGHADPAGVAATRRQYLGLGHGHDGRAGQEAFIVVPHVGAVSQLGVDDRQLLEAFAQVGVKGVHFRFTKVLGNGQMLRGCQIGHMQHQGFVFHQCGIQGTQGVIRATIGQIQVKDFSANGRAKGADSERLGHSDLLRSLK